MARTTPVRAQGREKRSLVDLLDLLDERVLATLLRARPDLAHPPPRGMMELAVRAGTPASVEACRRALDLAGHQVHAALCLLPNPATLGELATILEIDEEDSDLATVLGRLTDRAIVVRDGDQLWLAPGLDIRHPAGLGPPAAIALAPQSAPALANCAQRLGVAPGATKAATMVAIAGVLSQPERLSHLLKTAPPGAADLVRRLAYDGPEGYAAGAVYNGDKTAAGWLVNRGVVAPAGWDTVLLVREAGLAIRGGKVFPDLSLRRPDLPTLPVDAAAVDRAAAERALRLVADVSTILDLWAVDAPRQLKAGGLGIQAVRRAAKAIDRSEVEAARVIELAAAAGLVSIDAGSDAVLPLPAYDEWSGRSVAGRWSHLVAAWMAWDLHVGLAGALDGKGKPIPPLMVRAAEPHATARRGCILDTLAEAAPAMSFASDVVYSRATWEMPALWTGGPASPVGLVSWTLAECELVGLCGLGALSSWGRRAATGDMQGAEEVLGRVVPTATSDFVVQADLTALAPAELVRPVLAELESMADLESRGAANLYRFTEASVRRSYEAGRTASDILGFLETHAAKGVPQALSYLVNDVGRRFGRIRVTTTACCLRSDDPSLLAEVVASRPVKRLGLRLLAPTVAAASADPSTVLTVLRDAGFLPAEEASDGSIVLSRPVPRRAVPDRRLAALSRRRPGESAGFGPAGAPFATRTPSAAGAKSRVAAVDDDGSVDAIAARLLRADDGRRRRKGAAAALPDPTSPAALSSTGFLSTAQVGPPAASLFETGATGVRPATIARGPVAVADLLERAMIEDWPVRLAYTNKRGKTTQLTGSVLDVGDRDVIFELFTWESRVLSWNRIAWARILTETEEEALG
ncbi:MAG TPA: helicase-associated domain-containing protein [Acidimicrobiales bacterium]|nr:helicase-associated domain-containing protein [Acidimicrobiales bacterium]